jgi:hypothetical protein
VNAPLLELVSPPCDVVCYEAFYPVKSVVVMQFSLCDVLDKVSQRFNRSGFPVSGFLELLQYRSIPVYRITDNGLARRNKCLTFSYRIWQRTRPTTDIIQLHMRTGII